MKNLRFRIVAMTLAASVLSGMLFVPASFSQTTWMTANIPFAFYIDSKQMPAGRYMVQPVSLGSSVMQIGDEKGRFTFVRTRPTKNGRTSNSRASNARIVFNRYGSAYFLSELYWPDSETGRLLIKSGPEPELIAGKSPVRVTVPTK